MPQLFRLATRTVVLLTNPIVDQAYLVLLQKLGTTTNGEKPNIDPVCAVVLLQLVPVGF